MAWGSVLDCLTPNNDGEGYNQYAWTSLTSDLNTANGGPLATADDLSNLSQLMTYTGLWVDVRQPVTGSLTANETANLQAFIASGRRVVLIGGPGAQQDNPAFSSWNDAILSAVGGPTGTTFFTSNSVPAFATSPVTSGVSAIMVPAGAFASSGFSPFADRVATVWGSARNAIVLLDTTTLDDDHLSKASDATFAGNLANWVAGGETDGASYWQAGTSGNWQTAGNWRLSEPPSIADDATFNLNSTGYTVTAASPVTARNLIVQNDHVTIDLSTTSSNLVLEQGISIAQANAASGALILTHSVGINSGSISATTLVVGGSGAGTLAVGTGVQLTLSGATIISTASSLSITGATVTTTRVTSSGTVSIADGSLHIATAASRGSLNTIHSLNLTGTGVLDLADTDLDLQTGSLATITGEIRSAYAGGTWTGPGISSSAAATDTTHLTAIGVILNGTTYGSAAGSLGTFDGINPAATDLLIKFTYYGDANLDGQVDGSDYTKIDNGFANHLTGWANGDFNYDGIVDGSDYTLIDNAFNEQRGNINSTAVMAGVTGEIESATVPEPIGLGVVTVAMLGITRRRSRSALCWR